MRQQWYKEWVETRNGLSSSYITCPRHLRLTLDAVLPVHPNDNVNYMYRAFLWMLYGGMDADMTICVHIKDVDFTHMKIRIPSDYPGNVAQPIFRSSLPETSYPIYSEGVEDLQMACSLSYFMEPGICGNGDRHRQRIDDDHVLRPKRRGDCKADDLNRLGYTLKPVLQNSIKKFLDTHTPEEIPPWLPIDLTPKKIETSGKYYRAVIEESMGLLTWVDPHLTKDFEAWKRQAFL